MYRYLKNFHLALLQQKLTAALLPPYPNTNKKAIRNFYISFSNKSFIVEIESLLPLKNKSKIAVTDNYHS